MSARLLPWLSAAALLAACTPVPSTEPDGGGAACTLTFVGDPNLPPELTVLAMGRDNEVTEVTEGAPLPLMFPIQGGRVAFVGVRASNVDPCTVELTGALRDPLSNQLRLDIRTLNLREVPGTGSAESVAGAVSTWSNIPTCPNQWSQQDLHGNPYELVVEMKLRTGERLTRTMNVVPYCAEPDLYDDCRCICQEDYVVGMACGSFSDGGVADGGALDGGM